MFPKCLNSISITNSISMAYPNSLPNFLDNIPDFDESAISSGNDPMLSQVREKAVCGNGQTTTPVSYEDNLTPPLNDGIDILLRSLIDVDAASRFPELGNPQLNVLGPEVREKSWHEQGAFINDEAGRRDLTTSEQPFVHFEGPSVPANAPAPQVDSFSTISNATSSSCQKPGRTVPKPKPKKKYESEDTEDQRIKNAKSSKLNRDKKKQELAELKNKIEKLKAREALSKKNAVELLGNIASVVKAVGGGDVIVSEPLAVKRGPKLDHQEIQEIANNADLTNRRKFRICMDLDAEGKSLVVDVD